MLEWEIALALDLALGHPLKIVQVGVSLKSISGGTLESANIVYREIIEREKPNKSCLNQQSDNKRKNFFLSFLRRKLKGAESSKPKKLKCRL